MARHLEVLDELIKTIADEKDEQEERELYRISQEPDVFPLRVHDSIILLGDQINMMLIISLLHVRIRTLQKRSAFSNL
jgi:hypothetical protein